jgi:hypothetical protein
MQGTGSQADPYQITSVDELIEYAKKDDVYLKIMNDIDFNSYSGWMLPTIELRCFEIDGDGHSLNNIYIKNASLFCATDEGGPFTTRGTTFKNMTMEIIQIGNAPIFTGKEFNTKNQKWIILLDCDIRIKSYPTSGIFILFNKIQTSESIFINIRRSIVNIDVYGCGSGVCLINSVDNYGTSTIEYSEIQVNIYNGNNVNLSPLIARIYIDNVAIFVNMDKVNNNSTYTLFNQTTLTNSYMIVKQDNLQVMSWIFGSDVTFLSTCFYNKDYLTLPAVNNLHALTTDQCKSVSKLTELGFVVS